MPPKVFICAGEDSGDQLGAALYRALREIEPAVEVEGYGGRRLREAGARVSTELVDNAVVGFSAVVPKIGFFRRKMREAVERIAAWRPDVVVPIDNPGFNMRLARRLKRAGLARVLYYVSPQVWAWRRSRIHRYRHAVDKILVLFPFEEDIYLDEGLRVEYVGHPIGDAIAAEAPDPGFRASIGVRPDEPLVGLFPGSRDKSVGLLLPLVLDVAARMKAARPALRFALPAGKPHHLAWAKDAARARGLDVAVLDGRAHDVMREARLAVATSGTTTLECLAFGLPMVIVYKIGPLLYLGSRIMLSTEHIGLANIVAGREVVPEFLDWRYRPARIAAAAIELTDDGPRRERCLADLAEARARLGEPGAPRRAAEAVLSFVRESARETLEPVRREAP